MIRPTQRAVILAAAGLAFALVPVVLGSSFWTVYVAFVAVSLTLLGVDLVLCPGAARVGVSVELPGTLYVGHTDHAEVDFELTGDLAVTAVLDTSELLEPTAPSTTSISSLAFPPGPSETAGATATRAGGARRSAAANASTLRIPLTPRRRGTAVIETLWTRWRGPLGLIERVSQTELARSIPIIPNVLAVRSTALELFRQSELMTGLRTERYLGDGSEFDALREFMPGLDHRTIDWKASARHRKLLNRQFRAERNHQVIVAYDTGRLMREPIESLPKLDHAINAGLLLGYVCLRTGDRVGQFAFGARPSGFAEPVSGVSSVHRLQHFASRLEYSSDETNFTLGLAELSTRVRRRSLIVLMTDFTDTITAELLLENIGRLSRKHLVVFVCLRDPTLYQRHERKPDTIVDLHEAVVTRELVRDRNVVIRRLRRMGVHCVDTSPGGFSSALLSTYLRIRQRELVG